MAEIPILSSTLANRSPCKGYSRFPQGIIERICHIFRLSLDPRENGGVDYRHGGLFRGRPFPLGGKQIEWKR